MLSKDQLLQIFGILHTPDELQRTILERLGCKSSGSPAPASGSPPPLVIAGQITNDALLFPAAIGLADDQHPSQDMTFQLDTGAFEPLLTADLAKTLNLPNQGTLNISGVNSASPAYKSTFSLEVTGTNGQPQGWTKVSCVVDPTFKGTPLLGLSFFINQKVQLTLDPISGLMTWQVVTQ